MLQYSRRSTRGKRRQSHARACIDFALVKCPVRDLCACQGQSFSLPLRWAIPLSFPASDAVEPSALSGLVEPYKKTPSTCLTTVELINKGSNILELKKR